MRTHVIFKHSATFVPLSPEDCILSVDGADWFVRLLQQIPELQTDPKIIQEDWGVVIFARRNGKRFWIGLSSWPDNERMWMAHFHHRSLAWQQWSSSGKRELQRLVLEAHEALSGDPSVAHLAWHFERDMARVHERGSAHPIERAAL